MAEEPTESMEAAEPVSEEAAAAPHAGAADAAAQMAASAMDTAQQAAATLQAETSETNVIDLPDFEDRNGHAGATSADLALLNDVDLHVKIELGRTRMYVEDVLRLNKDSIIELDKLAGDPVDIFVNDRHIARGEVLVLNENFCVRISEIMHSAASCSAGDEMAETEAEPETGS